MRHITILGAGLLIGTALAVIIPEGILALYSSGGAALAKTHHDGFLISFLLLITIYESKSFNLLFDIYVFLKSITFINEA